MPSRPGAGTTGTIKSASRNERLEQVETWMGNQWTGPRLVAMIAHKFDISPRQAYLDVAEVYARCQAESKGEQAVRLGRARWSWQQQYRRCLEKGDLTAANQALHQLTKLDGLYAPKKIELSATVSVSMQIRGVMGILDEAGLAAMQVVLDQVEQARVAGLLAETPPGGPEDDEALQADAVEVIEREREPPRARRRARKS